MKRMIFYDLDGTVIDTRLDICLAANHMRQAMGHAELEHCEIERYVGKGLHYLIGRCLRTQDGKLVEKGAKFYRDHYVEHMLDHSCVYPGVEEFLREFQGRDQAIVTNKPDPFSTDMLRALGILDYFFEVISGNGNYPKKPDPASVQALMRVKGIGTEEALFVGDSPIDIETAKKAGIEIAVITHGFSDVDALNSAHPDLTVTNFKELLDAARQRGW